MELVTLRAVAATYYTVCLYFFLDTKGKKKVSIDPQGSAIRERRICGDKHFIDMPIRLARLSMIVICIRFLLFSKNLTVIMNIHVPRIHSSHTHIFSPPFYVRFIINCFLYIDEVL